MIKLKILKKIIKNYHELNKILKKPKFIHIKMMK